MIWHCTIECTKVRGKLQKRYKVSLLQQQATEKVQSKSATATSYRKAQCMSATVRQATEKVQGKSATAASYSIGTR